jgi:hypothetical protein
MLPTSFTYFLSVAISTAFVVTLLGFPVIAASEEENPSNGVGPYRDILIQQLYPTVKTSPNRMECTAALLYLFPLRGIQSTIPGTARKKRMQLKTKIIISFGLINDMFKLKNVYIVV